MSHLRVMRRRALMAGAALLVVGLGAASFVAWLLGLRGSVVLRLLLALAGVAGAAALLVLHRLERTLRERTEGLAHAQELARVGSWSWEPSDDRGVWSHEMYRIFGRDPGLGAATRAEFLRYVLPEDRDRLAAVDSAMRNGESSLELECRIRTDDGRERVLYGLASADRQRRGRYVGTVQDVTELRAIERALRDRERQLADAQTLARFGSWELDIARDRLTWSDELCQIAGQPVGFSPTVAEFLALIHPDDVPVLTERIGDAKAARFSDSVYRIVRPDGEVRHVLTRRFGRTDPQGAVTTLWGTTQDISDRVESELELHRAREHAEAIITAMREGYALTVDGTLVAVNDALCTLTGFARDQLVGAGLPFPFWPTDQLTLSRDIRDRVVAAGGGTFEIELMRADGSRFDAEITAQPARRRDGSELGFVNTIRDVSERKRHEAALERERQELNHAQAVARVGSWQYNVHHDPQARWSAQLRRMLHLTPQDPTPTFDQFLAMIARDDRDRVRRALTKTIRNGQAWGGEFGMVAGDGHELVVSFHAECSRDEHGRHMGFHGTVQDITERAQRDADEQALRRIAERVAANADSGAVLDAVATEVQRLFGAHSGLVTRFDESTGIGTVISAHRADGGPMESIVFARDGETASAMVARTGEPARIDAPPRSGGDSATTWLAADRVSGGVAAPVMVGGRLWGTLAAGFAEKPVPPEAEQRLARFARLIAMAVANAEAWEKLTRQASTDALTGLANHRAFQQRLRAEVTRARRYGRDLSLVLFDLDHFKIINDTHGHPSGDHVLTEVGNRLREQARDGELVARIGGEEFAWLMPETDRSGAYQAAERLRRLISSSRFPFAQTITISAGVATSENGRDGDGDGLMRSADRALYWAKDGGRNRTFLYSHDAHALLTSQRRSPEPVETQSRIQALAQAMDCEDAETREHSERVAALAQRIAIQLGWSAKRARLIYDCGLLHDIGKIALPDDILPQPRELTLAEYEQVKTHAQLGAAIAADVLEHEQVTWIRAHHERWDGSGYPDQLAGDQIPDGAQILAVAESFDVITSHGDHRSHRPHRTVAEALAECRAQAGAQFSPAVVDALMALTVAPARDAAPPHSASLARLDGS